MVLLAEVVNLQFSATNITLIIVAAISGLSTFFAARNSKKLSEIHVLVNSNLQAAKDERAMAIQSLANLNERHAELLAAAAKTSTETSRAAADSINELLKNYNISVKDPSRGGDSNSGEIKSAS